MSKPKSNKNPTRKAPPIYKDDPFVFEVDHIIEKRTVGNKTEYFIKWSGYPDSANSWIEESNVTEDLVEEFNLREANRQEESVAADDFSLAENTEPASVLEEHQSADSYFEENLKTLGCNLVLQSTTEDFQLFNNESNANVVGQSVDQESVEHY